MDLAALEVEVDAAQRLRAAEALDDAAHVEQRRRVRRLAHRGAPQESRSTSDASSRIVRAGASGRGDPLHQQEAARWPISAHGWATSVRRGSK